MAGGIVSITLHDFSDPPVTFQQRVWKEDTADDTSPVKMVNVLVDPAGVPIIPISRAANYTLGANVASTQAGVVVAAGRYSFFAHATTWNGASVQLEYSDDAGVTWMEVFSGFLEGNSLVGDIWLPAGHARMRVNITGTPPVGITAKLGGVA